MLFTTTVEESVLRTGRARFLEPLLQGLSAAVQPNGDIVHGRAQAHGDPVARLPRQVRTPDDLGVFRLHGRRYAEFDLGRKDPLRLTRTRPCFN
jgi:hypothetical protein